LTFEILSSTTNENKQNGKLETKNQKALKWIKVSLWCVPMVDGMTMIYSSSNYDDYNISKLLLHKTKDKLNDITSCNTQSLKQMPPNIKLIMLGPFAKWPKHEENQICMRCHGQLFHNHLLKEKFKLVKAKLH
jgi:hypothetical protein